jgi:hypothetical protein
MNARPIYKILMGNDGKEVDWSSGAFLKIGKGLYFDYYLIL